MVENQYSRVLGRDGNVPAQKLVHRVFEVGDRKWRGIGTYPMSGFQLRDEFAQQDAEKLFDVAEIATLEPEICISGQILRGIKKPHDCPAFGTLCTPQRPLGATMGTGCEIRERLPAYNKHGKIDHAGAPLFHDWVISKEGQGCGRFAQCRRRRAVHRRARSGRRRALCLGLKICALEKARPAPLLSKNPVTQTPLA